MGVTITVIGANEDSDEYLAAVRLKKIIQIDLPKDAIGEILLFASATLMGQEVKDIDLLMVGVLQNYTANLAFYENESEYIKADVDICSFCTTIEIKSHGINGISRLGTDFFVKYGEKKHCVTEQSNKQKTSTMNFFNRVLSVSPYITNVIWFVSAQPQEIKDLLMVESKEMPANILGSEFSFNELLQKLVWQRKPYNFHGKHRFDSNYGMCTVKDLERALNIFQREKETIGELTRQKIECISNNSININNIGLQDEKMTILRGRAGTGKTIALIQAAIKLIDEDYARVQILTYNKALVSDIRRLLAFAEFPDLFEEKCLAINTMQSYFFRLINTCLYEGKLDGSRFLSEYDNLLKEIIDFIDSDLEAKNYIEELGSQSAYLNWDYILIDEAQDWSDLEQELIIKLYSPDKIVVADGGQQFVRNVKICDWSIVKNRSNTKLKYCLRQKSNLTSFVNHYTELVNPGYNKIISSGKMPGGKVEIIDVQSDYLSLLKEEIDKMKELGNVEYDFLCIVPHTLVNKDGRMSFKLTDKFEKKDIFCWDGTNEDIRGNVPLTSDEIRVIQYDSARGLEGWTVCCLGFDTFISEKIQLFRPSTVANTLLLESEEDQLHKYILNWVLIPLTRAIDTLIIVLDNPQSKVALNLKAIAEKYPDYVTWR